MVFMKTKKHTFFASVSFAWRGIIHNFNHERHMRFHLYATLLATIFGLYFRLSLTEWLILFIFFALIPALELFNTAIEEICNTVRDQLKLDYQATKFPRDLAAGAVFWASIFAFMAGLLIFLPKIINLWLSFY